MPAKPNVRFEVHEGWVRLSANHAKTLAVYHLEIQAWIEKVLKAADAQQAGQP